MINDDIRFVYVLEQQSKVKNSKESEKPDHNDEKRETYTGRFDSALPLLYFR